MQSVAAENVGPVSATLRMSLTNPARQVRITLFKDIDRIEIENAITETETGDRMLVFDTNLAGSQIRFEEVGAIARPGSISQGGDFLQGTRANRMTLNHFVDFALPGYHMVLSNWDAYAMQVNDSTYDSFSLGGSRVNVVVMEQQSGAGVADQGGDDFFLNRFAVRGISSSFDAAEAMRTSLAHQNPLHVVALLPNRNGPITANSGSLLSVDADNVIVTALKPAEDQDAGFVVRLWELGGAITAFDIDASTTGVQSAWHTSLVETDLQPVLGVENGTIPGSIEPNEIRAYRFSDREGDVLFFDGFESGNTSAWTVQTP